MSVELMVWDEPAPISRDQARATYLAVKRAQPVTTAGDDVPDVVKELPGEVRLYPDRHVLVSMDLDSMDEVSAQVFTIARAHGLVCYDPQRDLVHNVAPLGVYEGMQLHTGDGMIVHDPDLGLVHDVLGTLSPQNPFAALVNFGRHFLQVSPVPAGHELEYKEGTMVRAVVEGVEEVRQVFHDYATGDRSFLTRHEWTPQ
ncbi:hypothetical protein MF672_049355 [Actinomadura sp. ATCC 31491]|uniref:Uncharacterized protein n=1 Tax=Actinomadura luzonensis TaxID=2805427 RepID=A0ABT0GAY9_9ACTN|nr:hypothetical protein [Actinomadura luzonensis]MCK2221765.1 hypothetical protein [Actinomadura luzonensis]